MENSTSKLLLNDELFDNQDKQKSNLDVSTVDDPFFVHSGEALFEQQDPTNEKLLHLCTPLAVCYILFPRKHSFQLYSGCFWL